MPHRENLVNRPIRSLGTRARWLQQKGERDMRADFRGWRPCGARKGPPLRRPAVPGPGSLRLGPPPPVRGSSPAELWMDALQAACLTRIGKFTTTCRQMLQSLFSSATGRPAATQLVPSSTSAVTPDTASHADQGKVGTGQRDKVDRAAAKVTSPRSPQR